MDRTVTKPDTIPKEEADRLRDEVVRKMVNAPAKPKEEIKNLDSKDSQKKLTP